MTDIHLLRPNGAKQAPFAHETLCGLAVQDDTAAMWPGDKLRGVHWGKPYKVGGRWCKTCKSLEATVRS